MSGADLGSASQPTGVPWSPAAPTARFNAIFAEAERSKTVRVHRSLGWLLVAQGCFAGVLAYLVSGFGYRLLIGLGLGAALAIPAIRVLRRRPHARSTIAVVAIAQTCFSLLFLHLSAGRIEMHGHLFLSLALLALYRDWRLLPLVSLAIVAHHGVASFVWPGLALGIPAPALPPMAEYLGWLYLANAVLIWGCLTARRELREACEAQASHQQLLADLEQRVRERTGALEAEIAKRELTASALRDSEQQHRDLISRLPIGVFETTRGGRVNFANAHLLSMVGLPPHIDPSAISLADGRIFPIAERERMWHRLENQREVRGYTTTLRHFDGTSFDVVINARLREMPHGEELAAEGTIEDVTQRKRAERELEGLHGQLVLASRQAGMAEVATGVLHNVGNVLTSVNLIVHDVQDRLRSTRLTHLRRVVEILQRERPRLGEYLSSDSTGRQIPDFLEKLDQFLVQENQQLLGDVDGLVRHFEHIREIIVTQQGSAQLYGVIELLAPELLIQDALRLNAESRERHGISVDRSVGGTPKVRADRHKVLQILVNLLKNAKDALLVRKPGERHIRIGITLEVGDRVAIAIQDNGTGIPRENLTRIFQHGYTTKPTGHGFGLHSSVLAAREMGGDLIASSPGPGQGSTFTLLLPAATPNP